MTRYENLNHSRGIQIIFDQKLRFAVELSGAIQS